MNNNRQRITIAALLTVIAVLAGFNIARSVSHLPGPKTEASPTTTAGPRPPVYTPQTPSPSGTDPFTWPAHGSAVPDAISAVDGWFRGVMNDDLYSPPVLEDLTTNEAPKDAVITGSATVSKDGPTEQEISVPTNRGALLVTMDVVSGDWLCTGLTWAD
jgi:hypothetical protein